MESLGPVREPGGFKRLLSLLGAILGAALSVLALLNGLRDLFNGGVQLAALLFAGLATVLLTIAGLYLVLSKRDEKARLIAAPCAGEAGTRRAPRYPRGRKFGFVLLCVVGLSLLVGAIVAVVRVVSPPSHTVILTARFDGPDFEYKLTEAFLDRIRREESLVSVIRLDPLRRVITEEDGPDVARTEGKRHKAAIVTWGRYTTIDSTVNLVVHYEVLTPAPGIYLPAAGAARIYQEVPLAEFASPSLCDDVKGSIESICLATIGMSYYAGRRWRQAISSLRAACDASTCMPNGARSMLLLYVGNSYQGLQEQDSACSAYSAALTLDSRNAPAQRNLGLANVARARRAEVLSQLERVSESRE